MGPFRGALKLLNEFQVFDCPLCQRILVIFQIELLNALLQRELGQELIRLEAWHTFRSRRSSEVER